MAKKLKLMALTFSVSLAAASLLSAADSRALPEDALAKINFGLAVHVGCGNGATITQLARKPGLIAHGLEADAAKVAEARAALRKASLNGRVFVEQWSSPQLPYPDNYVNLLIAEPNSVPEAELLRALAPGGVGLVRQPDGWRKLTKDRPAGMGDWTHVKHGPDGNPVAQDSTDLRQVPSRLRFICDVLESWTHFIRSANGRLYIYHKGRFHARDAYNGALLWTKTDYKAWPGRIVAVGDLLYMHQEHPTSVICAIDGATGKTAFTTEEAPNYLGFIVADGAILSRHADNVRAADALTGKPLWTFPAPEHPDKTKAMGGKLAKPLGEMVQQLFAADGRVYFTVYEDQKQKVVGVDAKTGKEVWRCDDPQIGNLVHLALLSDGVLCGISGSSYIGIDIRGKGLLWKLRSREKRSAGLADSDFKDPRRAMKSCSYAGGLLWLREGLASVYGETAPDEKDRQTLGWVGIDIKTGKIVRRLGYPVHRDWPGIHPKSGQYEARLDMPLDRNWSGRCYDDIATPNCILAQTMEIVGLDGSEPKHIRGARGQCGIGYIVANNTVYGPPNQCIGCYPMIRGCIAYEVPTARRIIVRDEDRLEKGPAYGQVPNPQSAIRNDADWPMYRHDTLRTSCTPSALVPAGLTARWESSLGGRSTQPVIADGRVFAAPVSEGRVVAIDATSGKALWDFAAGSRIDSSPTINDGLCLFGCHDGYVYCLRAADGALVWRFNAAPEHRRIVSGEQIESPWPVFGAVLVHQGTAYATAGQYSAIDGGVHFWGLDPATGNARFHQILSGVKGDKAMVLPTHWYKHEDHALNNVLCAQGDRVRLIDQWGGWDFSAKDGSMVDQIGAVPQPGWPQGRISPGELRDEDRWTWAGWDRVTVSYLLRGEPLTFEQTLEMDPRTRFSGLRTQYMFFPAKGVNGIFMKTRGYITKVDPEPWLIPHDPKIYGWPNGIFKDSKRNELRAKLWEGRQLPIKASAVTITANQTLWIAGATPPPESATQPAASSAPAAAAVPADAPARLYAISMESGQELAAWSLKSAPAFEGIAVAGGRLYLTTVDGKLLCMAK